MGRPKGYDREKILEKAMRLFWRQGYESTSTQQLVDHLQINRNSMYSEFGSKKSFYEAALDHYSETEFAPQFLPLEHQDAELDEVVNLFREYAQIAKRRDNGRGCFLVNMTVEMGSADPISKRWSRAFIKRATDGFANALRNGKASGALPAQVDVARQADFLTSTWLGMLVLLRGGAAPKVLEATADVAETHLRSLGPGPVR